MNELLYQNTGLKKFLIININIRIKICKEIEYLNKIKSI